MANYLLYSINCGVMMLLGKSSHYMVWGGSWALRRETFEQLALRDAWRGTLSDDLVATKVLRDARRTTRFEPSAVVPSPLDTNLGGLLEFLRRQYVVTRFYTWRWWLFGAAVLGLPNLAWAALAVMFAASLRLGWPPAWTPLGLAAALYATGTLRGALRQSLVQVYFPQHLAATRGARWFDTWAWPLAGLVHWLGLISAGLGRHIRWRGLRYRLFAGGQIQIVGREPSPNVAAATDRRRRAA